MVNKKESLQDKVKGLYGRISQDFYLNRDDFEASGERFNSALLFGTLTELNKGNMLLYGEYGGGKTTSAEYLNAVFNGLPLDLVKMVAIRGNPQETKETIIGNPDYGLMNTGDRTWSYNPMWTHWSMIGPKIIDEFNRIPESNQATVLNIVDRGDIDYLRGHIHNGKHPFFATCNYADRGNNNLIPPILDRFDVAVESKFPGVANALHIAQDYHNDKNRELENPELTRRILNVLNSGKPYDEVQKELEEMLGEHREVLLKRDFPILTEEDRERVEQEIRKVPFDRNAEQYLAFLVAEMNTSPKYGQKRSIDNPEGDRQHGLYLQTSFVGSGSRREDKSLVRYAKSLAWLQNQDEVNLDHITNVAPYVLWHRIKWTPETEQTFRDFDRDDPLDLHITKTLTGDGTNEMPGVKKRFAESQENYQRVIDLIGHGKVDEALQEAKEYSADGKGHPIFLDTIKDLDRR